MTERQKIVLRKVREATRANLWYRAEGNGERVTLASLYYRGALERRAWRGQLGEPNAANEYRVPDSMH